MRYLALVLLAVLSVGSSCSNLPPVEVCYWHETYGAVCVRLGGKVYALERPDLTDKQKQEIEEWIKTQPK